MPRSWFLIILKFFKISIENRMHVYFFSFPLNISSGRYSGLKFSNPVEMNPALKNFGFLEIFTIMKRNFPFLKNSPIFVNVRQFLSVRGKGISYCWSEVIVFLFYQVLNAVRSENSALTRNIAYFADFQRNSVLMWNNREFKKYELGKKSIF